MKRIYKYPFPVVDEFDLAMPAGAEVLSVQMQGVDACIWAMVDPDAPPVERRFRVVGTGHPFEETGLRFVGTFQMHGGRLVFHLFAAGEGDTNEPT